MGTNGEEPKLYMQILMMDLEKYLTSSYHNTVMPNFTDHAQLEQWIKAVERRHDIQKACEFVGLSQNSFDHIRETTLDVRVSHNAVLKVPKDQDKGHHT